MKSLLTTVALASIVSMLVGTVVFGSNTGQVSATVTASVVALSVSDGSIAYGTVATSASTATGDSDSVDDTQTITNTGTVSVDFEIKGNNTSGWTLGASAGDATYKHATCIATCDSSPSWTALTTSYVDLDTGKTPSATTELDLQITVPTSNAGTNQETANVDIMATES